LDHKNPKIGKRNRRNSEKLERTRVVEKEGKGGGSYGSSRQDLGKEETLKKRSTKNPKSR